MDTTTALNARAALERAGNELRAVDLRALPADVREDVKTARAAVAGAIRSVKYPSNR